MGISLLNRLKMAVVELSFKCPFFWSKENVVDD